MRRKTDRKLELTRRHIVVLGTGQLDLVGGGGVRKVDNPMKVPTRACMEDDR